MYDFFIFVKVNTLNFRHIVYKNKIILYNNSR